MNRRSVLLSGAALLCAGCAAPARRASHEELVRAVTEAEREFARTMADRDHGAFLRFVSAEAVFLNGGKPLVGREAVGRHWERFYAGPTAPSAGSRTSSSCSHPERWRSRSAFVANPAGKVVGRFYRRGGSRTTAAGASSSTMATRYARRRRADRRMGESGGGTSLPPLGRERISRFST